VQDVQPVEPSVTDSAIPVPTGDSVGDTVPTTVTHQVCNSNPRKRKRKYNQSVEYSKLSAQLLTVMDSNGYALQCYVVPNGKHTLLARTLNMLVMKQQAVNRSCINIVSVDNASQIANTLKTHYTHLTGQPLTVLQDLWHARDRIERELVPGHPLISQARSEWREMITDIILARCTKDIWKQQMIAYRVVSQLPIVLSVKCPRYLS
jgi:ribosomal protein S8